MKTILTLILGWALCSSPLLAAISVPSPAVIPSEPDTFWYVNPSSTTLTHVLLTSNKGVTPKTYNYLVTLENSNRTAILKYLKKQNSKLP